jgi:phenylacetate-CoA ligase
VNDHFDRRETRDPGQREREQLAALPELVAHAQRHTAHYARLLAGVDARAVTDRAALARLPITRKSELHARQRAAAPFGGLVATAPGALAKIFMSPGPIYDPEGRGRDYWRTARSLYAAGFRAGDIVQNCFSYHFTPAGSMYERGLEELGCAVVPTGVGQTEMQAAAMTDLGVAGYVGTPSFLKLILEKADELAHDTRALRKAAVSGEAFPAVLRDALRARGIEAYQAYATADLGSIAYETPARAGLVVDEDVIVEIVRPGTGDPVVDGEVGEVVVTAFNFAYPLIRFATGDLSSQGRARAGAPTSASRAGWDARTRPPRCAGCSCIRTRSRRWSGVLTWSSERAWSSTTPAATTACGSCAPSPTGAPTRCGARSNGRCARSPSSAPTSSSSRPTPCRTTARSSKMRASSAESGDDDPALMRRTRARRSFAHCRGLVRVARSPAMGPARGPHDVSIESRARAEPITRPRRWDGIPTRI